MKDYSIAPVISRVTPESHEEIKWVNPRELLRLDLAPADKVIAEALNISQR